MGEPDAGANGCDDLVVAGRRGDGSPSREASFSIRTRPALGPVKASKIGGGPLNCLILSD